MKSAITCSSLQDPYVKYLILKMVEEGNKPALIIFISKHFRKNKYIFRSRIKDFLIRTEIMKKDYINSLREQAFLDQLSSENKIYLKYDLLEICEKYSIEVDNFNSLRDKRLGEVVINKEIETIINAGGGIFRKNLTDLKNCKILNAHMARLPEFKGMNVLEWSFYCNVKPSVTLHFIDSGIDTGDIIENRMVDYSPSDSFDKIRTNALLVSVSLYLDYICDHIKKNISVTKQNTETGRLYFVMHSRLKEIAGKKIAEL